MTRSQLSVTLPLSIIWKMNLEQSAVAMNQYYFVYEVIMQ